MGNPILSGVIASRSVRISRASIRLLLIIGVAIKCAIPQYVPAQTPFPQSESDYNKPMTFKAYDQHSGSSSIYYTLAVGVITSSTPSDFLRYYRQMGKEVPRDIWFHSPGGNLIAGLELGKIIRQLQLTTRTGGEITRFHTTSEVRTTIRASKCFSACAWAFLGGKVRILNEDRTLGVHQFYSTRGRESESRAQVTTAQLGIYLDQMQIDRSLLDIASLTTPTEVTLLTIKEAQRMNIDNSEQTIETWRIMADEKSGRVSGYITQKLRMSDDRARMILVAHESPDELLLVVNYTVAHNTRGPEDLRLLFDSQTPTPRIYPGTEYRVERKYDIRLSAAKKWEKMKGATYTMPIIISKRSAYNLCQYEFFVFDPQMPNCCIDAAPDIIIPTKGLRAIISAISSQGPNRPR